MSWFNASHLSSFAKQAFTTAQKSIDRVLDIKEEDQSDTTAPTFADVPGKLVSTGWAMNQWNSPSEEHTKTLSPSSEAITKPVTRTVVDESEDFFSAFLPHGDIQTANNTNVVSVPPAKSNREVREKADKENDLEVKNSIGTHSEDQVVLRCSNQEHFEIKYAETELLEQKTSLENVLSQSELVVSTPAIAPEQGFEQETCEDRTEPDGFTFTSDVTLTSVPLLSSETESVIVFDSSEPALTIETKSPTKTLSVPPKEILFDSKDVKSEDRQSDTPSPPVSAFSSGTSTTSDIEVLDHESVQSESSASSRQETVEAKAALHLMKGSFQLLSASTCGDFPRLDEYRKLTESCGSSSDAFERIDSFSVQSLDSRSVSEVNSDDEIPGNHTLASITSALMPAPVQSAPQTKQDEKEEGLTESMHEQSLDDNEMEESGRSATPVNCEQTDELQEGNQEPDTDLTMTIQKSDANETSLTTQEKQGASTCQILELQKVIEELSSRLEKRELQLLVVSKDKARLEEECDNLKDEMISLKEESSTVQSLKYEFTQCIAEAERKAQLCCKERDIAKKEIKGLREELASRLNSNETLELIKEKEEQIRELLEEGEKLSKQQLQHSNIIKKLRVKEKETDAQITKHTKKLKEQEEELKHLQQVLDGKEEVEKQHRENIKKLNAVVERQEKELSRLQTSSEELQEKNRSLQAALDSSYKELSELHKTNATKNSEAQELALSREVQAKEELSLALEKAQEESRLQQEALADQVADLRIALQRAEQQQAKKEDYLREEISELQQRLQEAETRNQELSQSVTSATRPLLRQIENLHATLGAQTTSWEKLEKNISDRLDDAQAQLAVSVEKERSATEELLAIRVQIASLQSQTSLLRQEKGRLQGQLDAEKMRREKLEDDFSREHVELENLKGEHTRVLEEAKREKLLLTNQLEMEKMKVEQEKKKCYLAQEALKEKERKPMSLSVSDAPASSTPTLSRSSSISGTEHTGLLSSLFSQEVSLDHSFSTMTTSISGTNLYEAARLGGESSVIESLQSQLKLREGEIAQLQLEIASLERSRTVMAEELVRQTNQNDEIESKVKEIPRLKAQMKDLEQRHNTILQMYGEKAEEAEELRLDLEDVKNMYKTQLDELLKNQKH
ncbi:TATA element modulatory factor-like isoform X2 [Xyrauchen texanus]|uniref:TATA element modulatory factor-like isoform X2 n=1 Tax=Xyrauchen texanus TaxID=154827 RepID=UPI002241C385|nr:TATA element modulatory factor-like isoform X2 [Xyrauchen texanus]